MSKAEAIALLPDSHEFDSSEQNKHARRVMAKSKEQEVSCTIFESAYRLCQFPQQQLVPS
ncbi:hypothetical protein DGMP_28350 [Desulfomarina profundi]|uniref:Uncharacterized protein n=1 Tax=Desulfomarina profundi TaxID=2772557 RepID=A0A8D5FIB0_9BACT|nr:hypothetical protein DGMP_28350 [Desulfomarina profundi]